MKLNEEQKRIFSYILSKMKYFDDVLIRGMESILSEDESAQKKALEEIKKFHSCRHAPKRNIQEFILGYCYEFGIGCTIDNALSLEYYKKLNESILNTQDAELLVNLCIIMGKHEIIAEWLKFGISINLWVMVDRNFISQLKTKDQFKSLRLVTAAKDIFEVIQKQTDDVVTSNLIAIFEILGTSLNARILSRTALQLACELRRENIIEALVFRGAILPPPGIYYLKDKDERVYLDDYRRHYLDFKIISKQNIQMINVFRLLADTKQCIVDLDKMNEEPKSVQQGNELNSEIQRIRVMAEHCLKESAGLPELHKSKVCYELGIFLLRQKQYFKDIAYEVLPKVTQDKELIEKTNTLLFYLTEKTISPSESDSNQAALTFAVKAGKRIPTVDLALYLSSKIFGAKSDLRISFELTEHESLTRNTVFLSLICEWQKQNALRESKQDSEKILMKETVKDTFTPLDFNMEGGQLGLEERHLNDHQPKKHNAELYHEILKEAEQDNLSAQFSLAFMLLEGIGVKQDREAAYQYLKKLATQNNHNSAKYVLELKFNEGQYTKKPLDKRYVDLPLLWQAAFHNEWATVSLLLKITKDNITISPQTGFYKHYTILCFAAFEEKWDVVAALLETLKNYPVERRNLNLREKMDDKTVLSCALFSNKPEVVISLLNLGLSIDKGCDYPFRLHSYSNINLAYDIFQAARDLFTLIENRSVDRKRASEVKETGEKSHLELNDILNTLGNGLNARLMGITALEMALQKGDQEVVDALIARGAELPLHRATTSPVIEAFKILFDVQQEIKQFNDIIQEQASIKGKGDETENKEKSDIFSKQLFEISEKIINLGCIILKDYRNLKKRHYSQLCYQLGTMLPRTYAPFYELIYNALESVSMDEAMVEASNAILFNLSFRKDSQKEKDILSYAIKAGDQLSPKVLVTYLSSYISDYDPKLWENLLAKDQHLTREDVFCTMFDEFQRLSPKQISALERKEKSDIAVDQVSKSSSAQAKPVLLTQFKDLTLDSVSEISLEHSKNLMKHT